MKNHAYRLFGKSESLLLTSMLFAIILYVNAQQPPPISSNNNSDTQIIELRQADLLFKRKDSEAQILKDHVVLYHQGATMECDSAYWFEKENIFEAFSNVRMNQGDTVFAYGDYLHYDGNLQLAKLRYNVRLEDKRATLFTDSLDYDRMLNLGYYFDGGLLVDEENELTSFWGQYDTEMKVALFSDSVKLVNENFTLYSDTLRYSTETNVADILGPSTIVSDSGYIYSTRGWYNTATDDAQLLDRSQVFSDDGSKVLIGDTIFYNRDTGIAKVYGQLFLQDTLHNVILRGDYGYYDEKIEYALATDSAYAIDYSQKDSLFLHGDTLKMITDSIGRQIFAYPNVRFYRVDLQGICDTMHYVSADSILYLKKDPVIWNEDNQLMGDAIDVYLNDSTIEKAVVKNYAFGIQKRPVENQFNQLKGKNLTAHFVNGEIRHVLVEGSAESLYYLLEKDSTVIGLNRTESPYLSMDLFDEKLEKLKLWPSTKAQTVPLSQLKPDDETLKGFVWIDYLRPINKYDIFRRNERNASEMIVPPRRFARDDILLE
jgi:lipopolysaccharide export system protein LptA